MSRNTRRSILEDDGIIRDRRSGTMRQYCEDYPVLDRIVRSNARQSAERMANDLSANDVNALNNMQFLVEQTEPSAGTDSGLSGLDRAPLINSSNYQQLVGSDNQRQVVPHVIHHREIVYIVHPPKKHTTTGSILFDIGKGFLFTVAIGVFSNIAIEIFGRWRRARQARQEQEEQTRRISNAAAAEKVYQSYMVKSSEQQSETGSYSSSPLSSSSSSSTEQNNYDSYCEPEKKRYHLFRAANNGG